MALSRLPSTAMPSAPPSSRARSFMAEATPCSEAGSASVTDVVAGVIAMPAPAPSEMRPAAINQYELSASSWARIVKPAAARTRPVTQTRITPNRPTSLAANRAEGIMHTTIGSRQSAATSELSPRTSCRNCKITKMKPKNAKNCDVSESIPAANRRLRNSRGSSSGWRRCSSQTANTAMITSPAAIPPSVRAASQPASGASINE